jgi:hypothetical protein
VRKREIMGKTKHVTAGKEEEYNSEEEDFAYSLSSVGKVRKKHRKLIKVSRRPDYLGAEGYMSFMPHVIYEKNLAKHREKADYEAIVEAMTVKKELSKHSIRCMMQDITGSLIPTPKVLPKGGEGLLKY